jgi:NAD(P)-dependent dehydrogenase (short-subunit alcohol dehydrogenase family)
MGRYGIYVNALAPGFFPTHMTEWILEKNSKYLLPRVPFGRYAEKTTSKEPWYSGLGSIKLYYWPNHQC